MKENDNRIGRPDPFNIQIAARPTEPDQAREGGAVNTPLVFFVKQAVIDQLNPKQSAAERAAQILQAMSQLKYLMATRQYKTGQDKALGEKLAPYQGSIQKLEMAFELVAYPLLEETADGSAIRECIRDAQEHPGQAIEEYPHRAPFTLSDEERVILGHLARAADLPIDPKKRGYSFTELIPRLAARSKAIMASYKARMIQQGTIAEGVLKKRSDIEREISRRRINLVPPQTKPADPKK